MKGRFVRPTTAAFAGTAFWVLTVFTAQAQRVHAAPQPSPTVGTGISSNPNSGYTPYGTEPPEGEQPGEILRERARAEERRRRMVEDANRLVVLTAQYRASVTEHRGSTAEDSKLLQNIEKLARSVKDRMRGQ